MHGVTTAIVAFIFAGVIWPHLIKYKVQFYAAVMSVVCIILLDSLAHMFFKEEDGGWRVLYAINGLFQIAALLLLVLSTGMSARELSGEMFNTIEVVRRGGEKETIIVPLRGEQPKVRERGAAAAAPITIDRDIDAEEAALDAAETRPAAPAPPPAPAPAPAPKKPADTSIPLE
jgi:hypothetical protein